MLEENQRPCQHLHKGNAMELGWERQFEKFKTCILYNQPCDKNAKLNGKIVCYSNNILITLF